MTLNADNARYAPVAAGAVPAKKKPSYLAKAFAAIVMIFVALIELGLLVGPSNSSSGSGAVATADATPALHKIRDTVHVEYWSYQVNGFHWTPVLGDGMMAERADVRFIIVDLIIRNDDRTASSMPKIAARMLDHASRTVGNWRPDAGFLSRSATEQRGSS